MRTIQEFCVFCCHKCHTILYNQLCNKWLPIIFKYILTNRERQRIFSPFFRLKSQGKERINEGKMNTQTDFVWHLWQQKTQTAVGCAPTRARESLAKKEKTMRYEKEDEEGQGKEETKDGQQVLDLDASSHKNNPSAQQTNEICTETNVRFGLINLKNRHCKMRFNFYSDTFDCFLPLYIQRDTSKNRRNLTTSEKI